MSFIVSEIKDGSLVRLGARDGWKDYTAIRQPPFTSFRVASLVPFEDPYHSFLCSAISNAAVLFLCK